jgi:acyl-CoA reductase-like NAD-dependent aldehyde dehydrogenase
MIVMPDCDLDRAVAGALEGAFRCAGQLRGALTNLILHRDVAGPFKDRFLAAVEAMTVGNPVSDPEVFYGPMINARFARSFEEHWAAGRQDGAALLCGGARWTDENRTGRVLGCIIKGFYMQACVWDGVTPEMGLFRTELFGPSVNLCTVDSFDQALEWAGLSRGPASQLHTGNRAWAERFKRESAADLCVVNGAAGDEPAANGFTRWQAVRDDGPDAQAPEAGPCAFHYDISHWDGF